MTTKSNLDAWRVPITHAIAAGDYSLALELCDTCDQRDPEVAFLRGSALLSARSFGEAAEELKRALPGLDCTNSNVRLLSDCLNNLGVALTEVGTYDVAKDMLARAWLLRSSHLGKEHGDTLQTLHNLAYLFLKQTDIPRAEKFCREVLEARQANSETPARHVASSLHLLASVYIQRGLLAEALSRLKDGIQLLLQDDHPAHSLAAAMLEKQSQIQLQWGDLRGARTSLRQLLDQDRIAYGDDHEIVRSTLSRIMALDVRMGEIEMTPPPG